MLYSDADEENSNPTPGWSGTAESKKMQKGGRSIKLDVSCSCVVLGLLQRQDQPREDMAVFSPSRVGWRHQAPSDLLALTTSHAPRVATTVV